MIDVDRDTGGGITSYPDRLTASAIAATLSRAIALGVLTASDDTIIFYDLSRLDQMLAAMCRGFPLTTLHAVAVKANPTLEILKRIRLAGHGVEVASLGEIELALAAGFDAHKIVFDSPVKTRAELELALKLGIRVNANTLAELAHIDLLYSSLSSQSIVGVRINPEIGPGSINTTSVAVHNSKFGVSLRQCHAALTHAFSTYPWLTAIHVHVGSQGMSPEQLLSGVGAVYQFFVEILQIANVKVFNVGGGLPAQYRTSDTPLRFTEYATALRALFPRLFQDNISLVTEFGRSIHAGCGWVASKIEYIVEHDDSTRTLFTHVGADMFLRKAYRSDDWHHDISVCDARGRLKHGTPQVSHVAGPLCFAGDYLDYEALLPADVCEGDFALIHDAGAYTFGMWSLYNSRQFPAIIGYETNDDRFQRLRPRQSLDDIVHFWSAARLG